MTKERHWTLTATLTIVGLANMLLAISYVFLVEGNAQSDNAIASSHLPWLSLISVLNIVWVILLFNWRKIGLLGFIITSIGKFIVNFNHGTRFPELLFSFVGIALIVIALRIKKSEVSGLSKLI